MDDQFLEEEEYLEDDETLPTVSNLLTTENHDRVTDDTNQQEASDESTTVVEVRVKINSNVWT